MSGRQSKQLAVGVVGCGRIAQTHLEALGKVREFRLAGVCDEREEAAGGVAEQYGCPAHRDHRELLSAGELDAAIICTPPSSHAEIGGFFLDNGVHVLCEKPLAVSSRDAEGLLRKARDHERILMMASKFRYVDDVVKAKGIVGSGILGDVVLFENVFCGKVDMRDRWNSQRDVGGGGVLIDNGTHSVDIARYLVGPIVQVQAEEGKRMQGLDVEDTCRLFFRTAGETMGAVDLSWSIDKERDSYIDVFGPEGTLSIGWKGSKYRQTGKSDWVKFGRGYDKVAAFSHQLQNFAGSILGREAPLITAEGSLASVRVIEAAYRSLQMNKWVDVAGHGPVAASGT